MFTFAKEFFKKYCILAILTILPWLACHFKKSCLFYLLPISFCWYLINININSAVCGVTQSRTLLKWLSSSSSSNINSIFLPTEPLTLVIIWGIFMSSMSTCMCSSWKILFCWSHLPLVLGRQNQEALGHSDINPETLGVGARLHGVESQFCQSLAAWP